MLLEGSFPRGNSVGNKSSERQSSSVVISRRILPGGNYLWGNCPVAIIQGSIIRGAIFLGRYWLGGNYPGDNFNREQLSSGVIVGGEIIQVAIV